MNVLRLGGVELNPQMVWADRKKSSSVAQTVIYTLGGAPVVYSQALIAGQSITLVAEEDRGWLRGEVYDQLLPMADDPGAVFELQVNDKSYSVMFRHQEAPALDMEAVVPRLNEGPRDIYTGTLKLMIV